MSELKLIKIKNVTLYTAICEHAQDCWYCLSALKKTKIPFNQLHYDNDQLKDGLYKSLSTWKFFDGKEYFQNEFNRLAIVHWESFYDDEEGPKVNIAVGLNELKESQLFANLDKVQE
jgi:hypothetical protein